MVIDSIQVMHVADVQSAPGSVSQVRESAALLTRYAKQNHVAIFGWATSPRTAPWRVPKVLEHCIDCSVLLDGGHDSRFRTLRSHKNRFGAVNELGSSPQTGQGMKEVSNPSAIFLSRGRSRRRAHRHGDLGRHAPPGGVAGAGGLLPALQSAPGGGGDGPQPSRHAAGGAASSRRVADGGSGCVHQRGGWRQSRGDQRGSGAAAGHGVELPGSGPCPRIWWSLARWGSGEIRPVPRVRSDCRRRPSTVSAEPSSRMPMPQNIPSRGWRWCW